MDPNAIQTFDTTCPKCGERIEVDATRLDIRVLNEWTHETHACEPFERCPSCYRAVYEGGEETPAERARRERAEGARLGSFDTAFFGVVPSRMLNADTGELHRCPPKPRKRPSSDALDYAYRRGLRPTE